MINRLVEALAAIARRALSGLWRHRRLRPALRWLRRHLPEAVALAGIVALIGVVNPAKLATAFGRMDWRIALLMMPVVLVSYLLRGLAWWVALRRIDVRLSLRRTLSVELAGQLMVSLPLGDLSRIALVRRLWRGKGTGNLTGTIAFQELTFTMMLGLGMLPRVAGKPDLALLVVAMTLLHIGIFTVIVWRPAYEWALGRVERIHLLRRFDPQLRAVRPAVLTLFDWRAFIPILVCQAAAVLLSFLLFNLALHRLGIHISYAASTFVLALSYVIAGMSLVPGGIGPFEAILTLLMVANGVPAAAGVAAALLYRGYNDVFMALVGAPFAAWIRYHAEPESRRRRRTKAA